MHRRIGSWALVCLAASLPTITRADDAAKKVRVDAEETSYIRVIHNDEGVVQTLETSIIRMIPADGPEGPIVDLVGVVHVADRPYFEKLNEELANYDAVLYEYVAPANVRPEPKTEGSPVTTVQRLMKDTLELDFQLDRINYTQSNFVHADMSPADFAKSMKERGETFLGLLFKVMHQSAMMQAKQQPGASDLALTFALFSKNRALTLKRVMAEQFSDIDTFTGAINGENGSTLITARNDVALDVLAQQLKKKKTKVAIFFGSGHIPDMEEKLVKNFGMKRESERWMVAWDLTGNAPKPTDETPEPKPAAE
jgi:hypothetical protein